MKRSSVSNTQIFLASMLDQRVAFGTSRCENPMNIKASKTGTCALTNVTLALVT